MAPVEVMQKVFERVQDVVQREVVGEELFALNQVGSWLWARLDGSRTLAELAVEVAAEFDVDEIHAHADTESYVLDLLEAGLVVEVGSRDGGQS
jgi:hypothetical protein